MNVILLHSDHGHILDTHVAIIDYIYICILALTTLKMVTWVAATCRLSQYYKITVISSKWIDGFFNKFYTGVLISP